MLIAMTARTYVPFQIVDCHWHHFFSGEPEIRERLKEDHSWANFVDMFLELYARPGEYFDGVNEHVQPFWAKCGKVST